MEIFITLKNMTDLRKDTTSAVYLKDGTLCFINDLFIFKRVH